jgi:hypothetical protein
VDEFINPIDSRRFRATNALWNELRLNDPWSVGYVSQLIENHAFSKKEDWETYYYKSGRERNNFLQSHPFEIRQKLNDSLLKYADSKRVEQFDFRTKSLNFSFGRTRDQLEDKGAILYDFLTKKILSLEECFECVRFRTICETWNGIVIRERNTILEMKKHFPDLDFKKTEGSFDHKYAVDYELLKRGVLICGIQVKPASYLYDKPYILKAKRANQKKNASYKNEFGKNVFDVVSQKSGVIKNREVLKQISIEI